MCPFPGYIPTLSGSQEEQKETLYKDLKDKLMFNLHPAYQSPGLVNRSILSAETLFANLFRNPPTDYEVMGTLKISFSSFCQKYLPKNLQCLPTDLQKSQDAWEAYEHMLQSSFDKGSLDDCLNAYQEVLGLSNPLPKAPPSLRDICVSVNCKIVALKVANPDAELKCMKRQIGEIVNSEVSDPILRRLFFGHSAYLFEHGLELNKDNF